MNTKVWMETASRYVLVLGGCALGCSQGTRSADDALAGNDANAAPDGQEPQPEPTASSAPVVDPPDSGGPDDPSPPVNLEPPPAPATADVPQPVAAVSTPNLRVLPWAGFGSAVTFTFDDTQPSQAQHWPTLEATGVPLTFFANPSSNWQPGFDATWSAVAAAGCELGNHTWGHCQSDLSGCDAPLASAEAEIDQTTDYIVANLGVKQVVSFAAPFGDTGWNPYAASRFLLGRGVANGLVPATGVSDWYNLPVVPVTEGQTQSDFNAAIDRARAQGGWAIFLFHTIRPTPDDWYAGVDIGEITASLTYGAAFGDVWLDTMGEIGAYTRAAQLFASLEPADGTWTWSLPAHFPSGKVLRVTIDGGTLSQAGAPLVWDTHGYYEVVLDAGTLTWRPD